MALARVPGLVRSTGRLLPAILPGDHAPPYPGPPGRRGGMGDDPPGEWVSVAEAARRLRISPRAVRDRVKHRSLTARPKGNAGREVFLPGTASSRETTGETAAALPGASGEEGFRPPPEVHELAELRHALGRAEGELAAELRRSADLAATVEHLRAELAEARKPALVRLLEAFRRR